MSRSPRRLVLSLGFLTLVLAGCGAKKAKIEAALDEHRLDYGRCEVIRESKEPVDGKEPWLAATVCMARFQRTILEVDGVDQSAFGEVFEKWKKEKGPAAVADARKGGSGASTGQAASGNDCPSGANCLNKCRAECEGKHGPMMDNAKMGACARAGRKPDVCVKEATNEPSRLCFLKCRGM